MTSPAARSAGARSADTPQARLAGLPLRVGAIAVVSVAFGAAYYPTIGKMVDYWSTNDMYSYGFLVPIISGYLIWLRRGHLRAVSIQPSFGLGAAVLGAGLFVLVVGRLSATNLLEYLSLPFSVWGVSLLLLGTRVTQRLTFPLAYLLTMVPFWDVFTSRLHLPFQLYSAQIGVGALRLLDIPVVHSGVFIELPNITLEVAQVCSGVNNLVAVLCIGVPLAHYYVSGWWRRLSIVAAAVLIAILSNGVRVAGVCLFAYHGIRGADGDIHGPFSLLRSLFISGIGFVALFWLIAYYANRKHDEHQVPGPSDHGVGVVRPRVGAAAGVAIAMLALAGTFDQWRTKRPVPLQTALVNFPTTIGRWGLQNNASLGQPLNSIEFDERLVRGYAARDYGEIDLLLGYLARQVQGRELGVDWSLIKAGMSDLEQAPQKGTGRVAREMIARYRGERFYIACVYILDGDVVTGDIEAKLRTAWNVLTQGRSNGGFMLVGTKIAAEDGVNEARTRVRAFLDEALPYSKAYLAAIGM
jgi:EpsI family protein